MHAKIETDFTCKTVIMHSELVKKATQAFYLVDHSIQLSFFMSHHSVLFDGWKGRGASTYLLQEIQI